MSTRELARILTELVAQGHGGKPVVLCDGEGNYPFGIVVDGAGVTLDATAEPDSLERVGSAAP